jgi:hypothetical protein
MKLTWENIHAAATKGCGFTGAQLAVLGITWPPRKGWLRNLIGKEITDAQYEAFKDAGNTYVNRHGKIRRRGQPAAFKWSQQDNRPFDWRLNRRGSA